MRGIRRPKLLKDKVDTNTKETASQILTNRVQYINNQLVLCPVLFYSQVFVFLWHRAQRVNSPVKSGPRLNSCSGSAPQLHQYCQNLWSLYFPERVLIHCFHDHDVTGKVYLGF